MKVQQDNEIQNGKVSENVVKATENEVVVKRKSKTDKRKLTFYFLIRKKDEVVDWAIHLVSYTNFIKQLGFFRYDVGEGAYLMVYVEKNVVEEKNIVEIIDTVIKEIELSEGCEFVTPLKIKERLYGKLAIYFSPQLLYRIKSHKPFDFVKDTKDTAFFPFLNGIVVVNSKGYELKPYSDFDKHIWKQQIIQRDFIVSSDVLELLSNKNVASQIECPFIDEFGSFSRYCYLLAGNNERFYSLCSLLGYSMHSFTEYKLHAIVLTDSTISDDDESNGRSGKSLLFKALKYTRNLSEIAGKDFDNTNKHKYDKANIDTQIIFIDDLKKNFDVESLFNDITEGITIDKKNQQPYRINPKIVLTSNKVLKIEGSSAKDRFVEFEVSSHFHIDHTPEDEFKHWFFRDWNADEWNKFDNFMLFCVSFFLKAGVIRPESINIEIRRLTQETSKELIIFFDEKVLNNTLKDKYDKSELYNEFVESFPDFIKLRQRTFTEWVRKYMKLSPIYSLHYNPYKKTVNEMRSSGKDYFIFVKRETLESNVTKEQN